METMRENGDSGVRERQREAETEGAQTAGRERNAHRDAEPGGGGDDSESQRETGGEGTELERR